MLTRKEIIERFKEEIGKGNILLGVGAGIHGHGMGPRAGAKAFREAIDACMKDVPLREAAKNSPELTWSIEKWGIYGEDHSKGLYAI